MLITTATLDQFFQRLNFRFQQAMLEVPTFWSQIATEVPSVTEQEVYSFLAMIPTMREWLGPRQIQNVAARAFAVPNKQWESTIGIDVNKLKDDQFGMFAALMPMQAQVVAEWRDRELARAIEAATTDLCWDGQPFFDTNHPVNPDNAGAGVNVNKLVGATYDINAVDPLLPYAAARAKMALWVRDDGQQMGTMGNLIMVHPNEEKYALQIANAMLTAQAINANSGAGVSNVFSGKVDVLVNPYLKVTTGRPWYLLCTTRGIKPFIWQARQAPNFVQRTAVTDENVFKLRQFEYGVDLRGAAFGSLPFLVFRMSAS